MKWFIGNHYISEISCMLNNHWWLGIYSMWQLCLYQINCIRHACSFYNISFSFATFKNQLLDLWPSKIFPKIHQFHQPPLQFDIIYHLNATWTFMWMFTWKIRYVCLIFWTRVCHVMLRWHIMLKILMVVDEWDAFGTF